MNSIVLQEQWFWLFPAALALLALFQLVYWFFLNRSANRGQKQRNSAPIMPSMPEPVTAAAPGRSAGYQDYSNRSLRSSMQVLEGLQGVSEIRLPEPSFGIGRFYSPDEQILVALDDRSISRRHAYFTTENNEYYLLDMNSSYGTSVLVRGSYQDLIPGSKERVFNDDVVRFGKTVKVRLRLAGASRSEAGQF
jgi:hypothetical protein